MYLVSIVDVLFVVFTGTASAFELSMMMNGIKALKAIGSHPNVIQLLAHCTHEGRYSKFCKASFIIYASWSSPSKKLNQTISNNIIATLDPIMAILLKEDNGNLRKYLKEAKNQLYENAKPQETILGMALDVAKGMSYLSELKVLTGKNVRILS